MTSARAIARAARAALDALPALLEVAERRAAKAEAAQRRLTRELAAAMSDRASKAHETPKGKGSGT